MAQRPKAAGQPAVEVTGEDAAVDAGQQSGSEQRLLLGLLVLVAEFPALPAQRNRGATEE